ncbi:kinesin-like protein costa isoform X2 [Eurosta solidaginis]|uniref:kinesin-like protein costa isoform X2 n=1 Tax=Eurosta solidaginis TaxID=178769 RepID=UPI0035311D39
MMEIPIQVAVRIYPCLPPPIAPATTPASSPSAGHVVDVVQNCEPDRAQIAELKDDNGNINETGEKVEQEQSPTRTSFCVQAIPMSLNTAGTALPGHLDNGIAAGLMQVGPHSFPVTHAFPIDCTQSQIFHQTVFPLVSLFMEGFDASVVTYGQRGTGKTYTLYGPGVDGVYKESEQGVVQRCVREIFAHMANHRDRTYAVNIGWVEIIDDVINDLLGVGSVHCNSVTEVFHWIQLGLNARRRRRQSPLINNRHNADPPLNSHTLFTLTLEQQWVSKGLIQHRLSTASFTDLCGSDRIFILNALDQPTSLPKNVGLQALEQVVNTLTDPALMYNVNGNIPYNQTTLTTLLKDSFGGRAQTLVILCVSPLERDCNETICNLQFSFKIQCVRNYVIMNTFSDDNTPVSPEAVAPELPVVLGRGVPVGTDTFGLQFAASQWYKLVANAEGLFAKLAASNAVTELDKAQIEEWLFLKQECEECLSSADAIRSQKQLGPIQEADEPEEPVSDGENSVHQNSDNESDCESERPDLEGKLVALMEELRLKTDTLIQSKYKEFMQSHPKAIMESLERAPRKETAQSMEMVLSEPCTLNEKLDEQRRRSIQPGASLTSAEIAMLNRVASREQAVAKVTDDFLDSSGDLQNASKLRAAINSPIENIQKKLRKLDTDIDARQRQIQEVEQTMQLKQNIITELVKNSDTRSTAKQRFHKKKSKLETEYEKTKKQLAKAIVQGKDKSEVERLRDLIPHIEQRLQDLASMKHIAGESGQKVKKLQQSLHESKKLIDDLQKKLKKDRKQRDQLEHELKMLKEKENNCNSNSNKALVKLNTHSNQQRGASNTNEDTPHGKDLKDVQARISHLDHILREKSENLEQYVNSAEGAGEKEGLRHEIRNLRRTRDHLLEQRCSLDRKLKRDKILSHREERKLLECDEAIEAIDAAIEFKNELICGHKSIDTSERVQREKGEKMLMARLNKLSAEEMRTLLYKYFTKVIDLRDSSRNLEVQLMQLERERDAWEWKERVLSNAVRQARLEGERNAVLLQRQHEMKLTLMLRHLAEETSASTSSMSFSDQQQQQQQRYMRPTHLALAHQQQQFHTTTNGAINTSSQFTDSDLDLDFYKNVLPVSGKILKPPKHGEMEICPMPDALAKYKPLDKFKEKERDSKNKLIAKFHVLTRYAGQSMTAGTGGCAEEAAGGRGRKKDKQQVSAGIPQENLKRLISPTPVTKVTRQKNKIIIQDATRRN